MRKRLLLLFHTFLATALWALQPLHAETVTDVAGRTVELPEKVERILLGEGRMLYPLAILEGEQPLKRIVGWQGELSVVDAQGYAAFKAKYPQIDDIPKIGKTSEASVSPEKVMSLNPDLAIFGLAGHGPGINNELVKNLEKAGIPIIFIDFRQHPMRNTLPSMQLLGKALQREEQAQAFIDFYQSHLDRIKERVASLSESEKQRVFIELHAGVGKDGVTCCLSAGKGNYGELIEQAGGINLAAELIPGVTGSINLEHLIAVDPDIYLMTGGKGMNTTDIGVRAGPGVTPAAAEESLKPLVARTGIDTLTAVKQRKVHGLWHNFYNSPMNVLAIEAMAKWFYPDRFQDVDPTASFDELNERFFDVDLRGAYWSDLQGE